MPRVYNYHPMQILGDQLSALDDQHLIPTRERVAEAKARARELVQALNESPAWMFQVDELVEHGSLSRGTALREFGDIDVLVLLNEDALKTGAGTERTAEDTIRRMAQTLRESPRVPVSRGEVLIRPQTHSVGVTFNHAKLRVDLVPAVRRPTGLFIPRRVDGEWIRTYVENVSARLSAVAVETPWVKRAVRLLKGWRIRNKDQLPLSSYALETLVVNRAARTQGQLASLIYRFFKDIADEHMGRRLVLDGVAHAQAPVSLEDPYTGLNLTEGWGATERKRLMAICREDLGALQETLRRLEQSPGARIERALNALFLPGG